MDEGEEEEDTADGHEDEKAGGAQRSGRGRRLGAGGRGRVRMWRGLGGQRLGAREEVAAIIGGRGLSRSGGWRRRVANGGGPVCVTDQVVHGMEWVVGRNTFRS